MARVEELFKKRGQRVIMLPQTALDAKKRTIDLTLLIEAAPSKTVAPQFAASASGI